MRSLSTFASLLLLASPLAAQAADHDAAVAGGGVLPTGWAARPDAKGEMKNVKFVAMGDGYHATLGPATIVYRAADNAVGAFHTLATFTQTKAPAHAEGYGIFMGGTKLGGPAQAYTYFLVRGDGSFIVKQRTGDKTTALKDWSAHPAVNKADSAGKAVNKLEIDNKSDPSKVGFLVNGQEVFSTPASAIQTKGIVGLRINHNLDVHIAGFALHQ